jgi:hypothetical protein
MNHMATQPVVCHLLTRESLKSSVKNTAPTKRKRLDSGSSETQKKNKQLRTCSLLRMVRQYGLLEALISNLCADDLLALLLSSKSMYQAIAPRPGSLETLLGKLNCSGRGVAMRNKRHKKSSFFYTYQCTEYVRCRANNTRPCSRCKVATCDDCRIHCVYQSHFEKPCEDDELPNFSGFVLLSPPEVPILSPHHMEPDPPTPQWQDPSLGQAGPYHDQGYIDVPFEEDIYGPPELVEDILDLDLGQYTLTTSASSSDVPDPSPVLAAFHHTAEQRKRWFCKICLPSLRPQGGKFTPCHCTLRNKFLDRWLCLRCYEKEEVLLSKTYSTHIDQCGCGQQSGSLFCLWCRGDVLEPPLQEERYSEF